jgi:hypothetical protein
MVIFFVRCAQTSSRQPGLARRDGSLPRTQAGIKKNLVALGTFTGKTETIIIIIMALMILLAATEADVATSP